MSLDSVSECVASLSSTYLDAIKLTQQINAKRKSRNAFEEASIDAADHDLQSSLDRGESAVRIQYERTYQRCGDAFAHGDRTFPSHNRRDVSLNFVKNWPGMRSKTSLTTFKDESLRILKRNWSKTHSSTSSPCRICATRAKIEPS